MSDSVLDATPHTRTERPKLYAVVLINDDFTTIEFVETILMRIFGKTSEEASAITMDIHKTGKGVAGVYTHEVAETKAMLVEVNATRHEFPLKADVQPA